MADWLTHLLIAWTGVELVSLKWSEARKYGVFALIGAVIPDLGNFTLFLGKTGVGISSYFAPLHTPVGVLLLVSMVYFLSIEKYRKTVVGFFALGALSHIFADLLIETVSGKIMLTFPFNLELYGWGMFPQGGWTFLTLALISAVTATGLRTISNL